MKILLINGPNINMLEKREIEFYGSFSLSEIEERLIKEFPKDEFTFFQSNFEGAIIEKIQEASDTFQGMVINPGAYSHYSLAIKDALGICKIPKVEVHLSNISAREPLRQQMLTAQNCDGCIFGFKENVYILGVKALKIIV